jgi:hypothetical protein
MADTPDTISIIPIRGIPEIMPGDDLVKIVSRAVKDRGLSILDGDIVVFAQKIISKAENRIVKLSDVKPSPFAMTLAREVSKDGWSVPRRNNENHKDGSAEAGKGQAYSGDPGRGNIGKRGRRRFERIGRGLGDSPTRGFGPVCGKPRTGV